jgi:group I intron endonuclease
MADAKSTPYGRVYLITNQVNGKKYVGQTVGTLSQRMRQHCSLKSHCRALSLAIAKYGKASFSIEELATAETLEALNALEMEFVSLLSCLSPHGYNLKEGGGSKGAWSEEMRRKILTTKADSKYIERLRETARSVWERPGHRAKMGQLIRDSLSRPEVRDKRSVNAKQVALKEDVKLRMSNAQKSRYLNQSEREKVSEATKIRCKDPEYLERMSAATKKAFMNPEYRAAVSNSLKQLWLDPEYRVKMIAAQKAGKEKKRLMQRSPHVGDLDIQISANSAT